MLSGLESHDLDVRWEGKLDLFHVSQRMHRNQALSLKELYHKNSEVIFSVDFLEKEQILMSWNVDQRVARLLLSSLRFEGFGIWGKQKIFFSLSSVLAWAFWLSSVSSASGRDSLSQTELQSIFWKGSIFIDETSFAVNLSNQQIY